VAAEFAMPSAQYLESGLLASAGFRHAFFTRLGGVSGGAYASLNFSISVGDQPENVAQNMERAASALSVPRSQIFFASQVHGSKVRALEPGDSPANVLEHSADGLVSSQAGFACAVRTADCVPVLIADPATGAVAAAHAGWRGVVCGIVGESVAALAALGGSSARLLAAIGPHISPQAFEVSDEVADSIASAARDPQIVDRRFGERPHVNLRRAVRAQLRNAGLPDLAIDDVHGCTFTDPERFFSFRRDGRQSGRHLAAIVARRN
jgi:YfiH family protein